MWPLKTTFNEATVGAGFRISAIGDSITAGCNNNASIGAGGVTSAGALLAITTTSSHYGLPNAQFYLSGATQDEYNDLFTMGLTSDGYHTVANVPFAGSTTSPATTTGTIDMYLPYQSSDNDWLNWASQLSGGAFVRGIPMGFPGKTASYIQGKLGVVLKDLPNAIAELSGANDLKTLVVGDSAATVTARANAIFATRKATWNLIIANGRVPIAMTNFPTRTGYTGWNINWNNCVLRINKLIREYCLSNRNIILCDAHKVLVDPTDVSGQYLAAVTSDGLHLNGNGAYLVGLELYNTLVAAGLNPRSPKCLPDSALESYTLSNVSLQLNDNPLGTGTAGTVTAPATGTAITGWTLTATGTTPATVAGSTPARSDGFGNDQQIIITPTANTDGATLTGTNYTGKVNAGDILQGMCEITISGAAALKNVEFQLNTVSGGKSGLIASGRAVNNTLNQGDKTYTIITPAVMMPPAGSNVQPVIKFVFSGAQAACTVKIGRCAIWKIG
jgi:hypothetical protein